MYFFLQTQNLKQYYIHPLLLGKEKHLSAESVASHEKGTKKGNVAAQMSNK
jgi:hypothetical protein